MPELKNRNKANLVGTDFLEIQRNDNLDYIRLKNLPVEGYVWDDVNLNGLMDDGEQGIPGIKVTLFDNTNNKKLLVVTDSTGKYKFTETNGEAIPGKTATRLDQKMVLNDGRVIKGTNRDQTTGNYNTTSEHIQYYIQFEYDGGKYETIPIEKYANDKNLMENTNQIKGDYQRDSNAIECEDMRIKFNERLQTISYNLATSSDKTKTKQLEYDKDGHVSTINITNDTAASMVAYSFISTTATGLNNATKEREDFADGEIRYLWFKDKAGNYDGETEYLQYINMGLTKRLFDLSIEQDLYSIKNTINGQEMTYIFNQGNSAEYRGAYITAGEANASSGNAYKFRLYNSDYYYKSSQYDNEIIQNYKENTELNVEVTFNVKVTNKNVGDGKEVYAKINEIVDFYSTNFMEAGTSKVIKKLDSTTGYLKEETIKSVEAWMENEEGEKTSELTVEKTKAFGVDRTFTGYRTLYISGDALENKTLKENESLE